MKQARHGLMTTHCAPDQLEFQSFGRRQVTGRFDGGGLTSDGGGLLLREVEQRLDLFADRTSTATLRANQLRIIIVEKGQQDKAT